MRQQNTVLAAPSTWPGQFNFSAQLSRKFTRVPDYILMNDMAIEIGMPVEDKNGQTIGKVDHVVMDTWSGEPKKYVLRLADNGVSAAYFAPGDVAEAARGKVRLNVAVDEMERT